MPSPFPGMDPYLESPVFWSSFHTRLMIAISKTIELQLGPEYYVEVETRSYQSPDAEKHLLMKIPVAVVFTSQAKVLVPEQQFIGISITTQSRPERVTVPVPLPTVIHRISPRINHLVRKYVEFSSPVRSPL